MDPLSAELQCGSLKPRTRGIGGREGQSDRPDRGDWRTLELGTLKVSGVNGDKHPLVQSLIRLSSRPPGSRQSAGPGYRSAGLMQRFRDGLDV